MVKVGATQLRALKALQELGSYPGAWVLQTHRQTRKVLDSLVARGLAEVTEGGRYVLTRCGARELEGRR